MNFLNVLINECKYGWLRLNFKDDGNCLLNAFRHFEVFEGCHVFMKISLKLSMFSFRDDQPLKSYYVRKETHERKLNG